jgi:hypothetical protein
MNMKQRNEITGELAPIHRIGTDEDGREIISRVDGWDLCRDDGSPLADSESDCVECDEDGNYLIAR